jgi:hypothetical protein
MHPHQGATPTLITPTMMASTLDKIIVGFPHSRFPKVAGEQTFKDLKVICRLLNTNPMSVSSYECRGRHGHLGLNMSNYEYFAVATDVSPPTANPGAADTMVVGMMTAQITVKNRVHMKVTRVYRMNHNVDQALEKLIIADFEDPFPNALSDEIVGYANCTSL